jgi:hypothetical protein
MTMLSAGVLRHFKRACSACLMALVESTFLLTKVFHTWCTEENVCVLVHNCVPHPTRALFPNKLVVGWSCFL